VAERFADRWLRPRIVLPTIAVALLIVALLTPAGDDTSPRFLTTRSRTMNGARAIREVFEHLGWKTSERLVPYAAPLDSGAVYLVLGTPVDVSRTEVHALLNAVRAGAAAVLVPERESALADSLGIQPSPRLAYPLYATADSLLGSGDPVDTLRMLLGGSGARIYHQYLEAVPTGDSDSAGVWPPAARSFLSVRGAMGREQPEIALMRIGRGAVMVIGDPNFLRNDVVKKTAGAMLAVRMIERLEPTGRAPLVFDEFHQGFGEQGSPVDVIREAMTRTTWGRAALQIMLAALLYLLMIGVRPIPPRSRARLERRSPLEHVGALSRAYETIGATKLVAQRLVRGVRRRHPLGAQPRGSDAEYLALLRQRLPTMSAEIDTLANAIANDPTAEGLVAVGSAIDHIERNFTT
jgi:hypothetical protein